MKKTLQVLNIFAFLLMVAVNYISNTGAIAGETMATISAKYENLFTPAGYAFSIWGVIYLFLLGFVIYQARDLFSKESKENVSVLVGWWFVISCVANVLWIFAWLNEYLFLSVMIMLVLLFSLIKIVLNARMELDDEPLRVIAFVWWPFCFYSGWISVALIANMAAYLTSLNWNGLGISEVAWTIIMILVAGIINLIITWTRNMREFALVGVWALVAIAVANWNEHSEVVFTALAVAAILFVSSSIHGYQNGEYSPWKKL
ncbi:tryptophan-rich sensory protein [Salinimicrobium catena]|uniref:tryptophan-rich sensory protein n=1 Tax=Salinimicrobium catena TaxID=390640 RepID=UPI002FE4B9E4